MPRQDSEPPMAVAAYWVSRITNISLEMVLPAGLGYWLDRRLGTEPWLLSAGTCLGMFVAMVSLVQLSQQANAKNRSPVSTDSTSPDVSEPSSQRLDQQEESDRHS